MNQYNKGIFIYINVTLLLCGYMGIMCYSNKLEPLIVPFSNNLAVEFDLLKATKDCTGGLAFLSNGYILFSFKATEGLLIPTTAEGSESGKRICF